MSRLRQEEKIKEPSVRGPVGVIRVGFAVSGICSVRGQSRKWRASGFAVEGIGLGMIQNSNAPHAQLDRTDQRDRRTRCSNFMMDKSLRSQAICLERFSPLRWTQGGASNRCLGPPPTTRRLSQGSGGSASCLLGSFVPKPSELRPSVVRRLTFRAWASRRAHLAKRA
jgi:hypothetical protein